MLVTHTFEPIYNHDSEILILGSIPSVKSRENCFYYGHPRNRFWKVISAVLQCAEPESIEEKKQMLLAHRVALWDVIHSCEIHGSSDGSIRNVVPNDIRPILEASKISRVFANGSAAGRLYRKFCENDTRLSAEVLPSTSPANASYSLGRLVEVWSDRFNG